MLVSLCGIDRVGKSGGEIGVVCLKGEIRIEEDKIQEGWEQALDCEAVLVPVLYHFEVPDAIITVVRTKRRKRRRRRKRK